MHVNTTSRDLKTIGLAQTQLTRDYQRQTAKNEPLHLTNPHVTIVNVESAEDGATITIDYTTATGGSIIHTFSAPKKR